MVAGFRARVVLVLSGLVLITACSQHQSSAQPSQPKATWRARAEWLIEKLQRAQQQALLEGQAGPADKAVEDIYYRDFEDPRCNFEVAIQRFSGRAAVAEIEEAFRLFRESLRRGQTAIQVRRRLDKLSQLLRQHGQSLDGRGK